MFAFLSNRWDSSPNNSKLQDVIPNISKNISTNVKCSLKQKKNCNICSFRLMLSLMRFLLLIYDIDVFMFQLLSKALADKYSFLYFYVIIDIFHRVKLLNFKAHCLDYLENRL